jgi:hypothetical protein
MVVYSAKQGEIAFDDSGGTNSPFAAAVLKEAATPGAEINKLF